MGCMGVLTAYFALSTISAMQPSTEIVVASTQPSDGEFLQTTMTSSDPSSTQLHNGDHEEGLETRRSQQHKGLQQIDTTSHEVAPGKARSPDKSQSQEDSTLAPQLEQTLLWNSVNVTRPAGKLHIRLGEEEMLDCFRHTSVAQIRKDEYDLSPTVINTTQFYRELYAAEGSVTGEINLNQTELRVRSEHLNESIECSVGSSSFYTKYCCVIRVRVPIGFHVVAEVMESSVSTTRLYDDKYHEAIGGEIFDHEEYVSFTGLFVSASNFLDVLRVVTSRPRRGIMENVTDRFVVKFHMVANPGFRVRFTTLNRGIVQTFVNDDNHFIHHWIDPWAYITVPSGHQVLVSVSELERLRDCLALHAADRNNQTLWSNCHHDVLPRVTLCNTSLLFIQFLPENNYSGFQISSSFHLRFSFHAASALPEKDNDGLWNCSGPYKEDLIFHLSCNLEVECQDAADETACPYTSDACGNGYLTLGGACFFYLDEQKRLNTSHSAVDMCLLHGGRLASLNTPEKWRDAMRVLFTPFSFRDVLIGLRNSRPSLPQWYKRTFWWSDGTAAMYMPERSQRSSQINDMDCGRLEMVVSRLYNTRTVTQSMVYCDDTGNNILCEKPISGLATLVQIPVTNNTSVWPQGAPYVQCPLRHYTHLFLVCDVTTFCWRKEGSTHCEASLTPLPPSFACSNQIQRVPYTLVCDHRADCTDNSDEDFCGFAPCLIGEYSCDNGQCVPKEKKCDGWEDCYNGNDESYCYVYKTPHQPIPPPALVTLSDGGFVVRPLDISPATDPSRVCPGTHFLCPHDGYCLPLLFRCNGLYDCPGREDEAGCDGYTCPGFYRCRATSVCLPPSQLCDGRAHCPQHDDELMCDLTCPLPCQCRGLAFFCQDVFTASAHPHLRFLDASGSSMTPELLSNNLMLIHLSLADCNLTVLDVLSFPNLLILDISYNRVSSTRSLRLSGVPLLRELSLAGNPLVHVFEDDGELSPYSSVWKLDLSRVALHVLNASIVSTFPNLRILNLSHSGVERAPQEGFRAMRRLRVIDLRGCPMTWFPPELFRSLSELRTVYAHSFKMCCPVLLPADFNVRNCLAPSDEISSCEDLLQSGGYRMFVFLLSILAVLGNAVSFVFRTVMSKRKTKLGYGNFVTHLSVSDFVMGVYLAIIGVADRVYQGAYLWNEVAWKHSVPCRLAGFLSLLSSEVSALIMCLITLDRFLVLRFPFSRLHFSPRSAHAASAVAWLCGVLLAAIPLLPATAHWHFYSQTGICIPLPITRSEFAGHGYSFSIFIVLNFVLFFFICAGQVSIYWSIRTNSMSASNSTKAVKDLTIARRLITVAMSDFLCWFPIGLLGLLASSGVAIPGEVNVAVAIFVLPLNSTINPCLYTLNVIMERRRLAREDKLCKMLLSQLNAHF